MKPFLQRAPLFLFLIPLFFVLHGYSENFGYIDFSSAMLLAITYGGGASVIYFIFLRVYKDIIKASLITSYIISFYLFFGAIMDFLKDHHIPLNRYSFLSTIFLISLIAFAIYLKRTWHVFYKATLFLNLLMIIYVIIDLSSVAYKIINPKANKLSVYSFANKKSYPTCKECPKPDIYFLLFDSYTGTKTLKERYHYDNSRLDTFLLDRGFSIQKKSRSNYFFTAFSMTSALNMSYIDYVPNVSACTLEDYQNCINNIKENEVINILSGQGYDIVNYSVFDLAGNPSKVNQYFLPLKTKLISGSTFGDRFIRDLGWIFTFKNFNLFSGNTIYSSLNNNNNIISAVERESQKQSPHPRFIYAHLYLPHAPYYFDKNGNPKKEAEIFKETAELPLQAYLDYLPYTESKAEEAINTIMNNTNGEAVIIFMSDHAFNNYTIKSDSVYSFQNQNAVYFPDKDYHLFYDSITNVNQFKVIFNKMFKLNIPLLKDSVIFLRDKK
ncbi:MAG: hypothetical protein JST96_13755 [Bacteroidetes bacterium]|nr:hypothetical protein [Bacteroidota bacterium]